MGLCRDGCQDGWTRVSTGAPVRRQSMQKTNTLIDPNAIFRDAPIFSSFAVKDIEATRQFYGRTLGLDVRDGQMGGVLEIHGKAGPPVWVYPKPDHKPAVFTVLNLQVRRVDEAVDA